MKNAGACSLWYCMQNLILCQSLILDWFRYQSGKTSSPPVTSPAFPEIYAKTLESKLVKGLYFAGEALGIDGLAGGFRLQTAFSTGYLMESPIAP